MKVIKLICILAAFIELITCHGAYRFLAQESCETKGKVVVVERCVLKDQEITYIVNHIQPVTKIEVIFDIFGHTVPN